VTGVSLVLASIIVRRAILAILAMASCGGGGEVSQQLFYCRESVANGCPRFVACQPPDASATVAECTAVETAAECTPDQVKCPPGRTYHPDEDALCAMGFTDWTCAEVQANYPEFPPAPAACVLRCQ
jgi:hypothetical protein